MGGVGWVRSKNATEKGSMKSEMQCVGSGVGEQCMDAMCKRQKWSKMN